MNYLADYIAVLRRRRRSSFPPDGWRRLRPPPEGGILPNLEEPIEPPANIILQDGNNAPEQEEPPANIHLQNGNNAPEQIEPPANIHLQNGNDAPEQELDPPEDIGLQAVHIPPPLNIGELLGIADQDEEGDLHQMNGNPPQLGFLDEGEEQTIWFKVISLLYTRAVALDMFFAIIPDEPDSVQFPLDYWFLTIREAHMPHWQKYIYRWIYAVFYSPSFQFLLPYTGLRYSWYLIKKGYKNVCEAQSSVTNSVIWLGSIGLINSLIHGFGISLTIFRYSEPILNIYKHITFISQILLMCSLVPHYVSYRTANETELCPGGFLNDAGEAVFWFFILEGFFMLQDWLNFFLQRSYRTRFPQI